MCGPAAAAVLLLKGLTGNARARSPVVVDDDAGVPLDWSLEFSGQAAPVAFPLRPFSCESKSRKTGKHHVSCLQAPCEATETSVVLVTLRNNNANSNCL